MAQIWQGNGLHTLAFFGGLHILLREAEVFALVDVEVDLLPNVGDDCSCLLLGNEISRAYVFLLYEEELHTPAMSSSDFVLYPASAFARAKWI